MRLVGTGAGSHTHTHTHIYIYVKKKTLTCPADSGREGKGGEANKSEIEITKKFQIQIQNVIIKLGLDGNKYKSEINLEGRRRSRYIRSYLLRQGGRARDRLYLRTVETLPENSPLPAATQICLFFSFSR